LLAAGVVGLCAYALATGPSHSNQQFVEVVILVALGWFCSRQRVHFNGSSQISLGSIAQVASILLLPLSLALPAIACAKLLSECSLFLTKKRRLRAVFVNVSLVVLSTSAGGLAFTALHGPHYLWSTSDFVPLLGLPALLSLAVAYYAVDAIAVSLAITLSTNEPFNSVFSQVTRDAALPEMSLIAVGWVLGIVGHFSPTLSVLIVVPVLLSVRSFAAVAKLRDETESAVKHMAESIDVLDTGTGDHSKRLEEDACRLAASLKLTPEHVHDVGLAARTHDLGKLGIGDAFRLKRGPLTADERADMERHPVIGADMLSSYSAFEKSVAFVRHHHERWDGKGYPAGLKGEEIPIGSRIIAVVDAYDAMTSDRVYRPAMPVPDAVERLKAGMGTQFDPRVCASWIQILIESGHYTPSEDPAQYLRLVSNEAV
jgi:HD-GYP domain-containing protein (c-di-GMP phosphodiesterase class II)